MTTQKQGIKGFLLSSLVGIFIVALCAFGLFALNGASLPDFIAELLSEKPSVSDTSSDAEKTQIITDSLGREVSVPVVPTHIAAMDAFSANVCVLTGAGEHLSGAPRGVTSNKLLQELFSELDSVESLTGNSVNAESLLAAKTDVVFIRRDLYENGEEVAKLDKLDIPYVVVDYTTIDEQMNAINLVGQVCGGTAQEKALKLTEYFQKTVQLVEEKAQDIPDKNRKRVYHSINDPLLTDGASSLGFDWITRVGAVDVSAQEDKAADKNDYTATLEQVYVWNPDVVICNTVDAKKQILADAQWQGIDAVSSGQVYSLPVSASRWGQRGDPETFLGMLWLGKTLYPEQYEDVDIKDTVISYYRDVVGIEIDDAMWERIISGEGLRIQGGGGQNNSGANSDTGRGK